jgi:transportin-1
MMANILTRILDPSKKVQEAACSAFATLEEEAQAELVPFLGPILQTLVNAFGTYQAKNLLILYDAIATLADSVGPELNKREYIAVLMPPLIQRWNMLSDSDRNLFPLLECLTSISTALGSGFEPFAQPVFERCVKLIENTVTQLHAFRNASEQDQETMEPPDKGFIVCALDLISGLAEGLGTSVESLVKGSRLLPLLGECMKDRGADVRQSSFALVGDLAKHCIAHLKPFLNDFINLLSHNLYPDYISVCNNASWALGEIAVKIGAEMKPFVAKAVEMLIKIMTKQNLNRNLLENTAITLGRLGLVAPEQVAPHLEEFALPWCLSLRNIRDDVEKDSAFRGMCMMIKANPNGVVKNLVYVCDAIASWYYPADDLKAMFHQILHMYKSGMGDSWDPYYKNFPEPLRNVLRDRYGL